MSPKLLRQSIFSARVYPASPRHLTGPFEWYQLMEEWQSVAPSLWGDAPLSPHALDSLEVLLSKDPARFKAQLRAVRLWKIDRGLHNAFTGLARVAVAAAAQAPRPVPASIPVEWMDAKLLKNGAVVANGHLLARFVYVAPKLGDRLLSQIKKGVRPTK